MQLLPAIDLREGRVVRLEQGDDNARTTYDVSPFEVLASYAAAGVERVHMVDLDGAFGKKRDGGGEEVGQRRLLSRLAASQDGGPKLQLGGGLRTRDDVEWAFAAGFERAVITSMIVHDFELFSELAVEYPQRIVAALDIHHGELRTAGWTESAESPLDEICRALRPLPLAAVLVTDISRDGKLSGPNLELACELSRMTAAPALLSGGVTELQDLVRARACPEIEGAIVGKALYDGRITLADALAACDHGATA
jgi:phosphoribosylformimino-5-aminoimidazole carboxamide ribotide isomerase